MKLIQIGSHRGYDDFTEIVKKINPDDIDFLLLIEPNSEFNENLKHCYIDYNPIIENVVIVTNNEKKTKFYTCNKDKYPDKNGSNFSELSSLIKEHLLKHNIDINYIDENEIDCTTINKIFEKYNIKNLDILFIDVEGFDSNLIRSIDFDQFEINKIYYENLHVNNDDIIKFLESKKYIINKNVLMNGWTNEATKIN